MDQWPPARGVRGRLAGAPRRPRRPVSPDPARAGRVKGRRRRRRSRLPLMRLGRAGQLPTGDRPAGLVRAQGSRTRLPQEEAGLGRRPAPAPASGRGLRSVLPRAAGTERLAACRGHAGRRVRAGPAAGARSRDSVGGRLPVTSTTRSCGRMLGVPGWPRNAKTHPAASTPPWPPSWRMTGPPPWPALPGTASTSERATTPEATQPRGRSPDRARHAIQPGLREPMVSGGCAGDVHPTTDLPRNATDAAGVTAHDRAAALADTTPAIYA
jgi:hypothetical protein